MPAVSITSLDEYLKLIATESAVAVEFYATWCGPCKMISPFFEALSDRCPNVKFVKIDVDEAKDIAEDCNISGMPTFLFYKDGKQTSDEMKGANKGKLEAIIRKLAA